MQAPRKPFRTYSADEMLQIIDFLIAEHAVTDVDALGMTRLALILKRFESTPYDDVIANAPQCYRDIEGMENALPAKPSAAVPSKRL
jgi:hypothetical protein